VQCILQKLLFYEEPPSTEEKTSNGDVSDSSKEADDKATPFEDDKSSSFEDGSLEYFEAEA